MARLRSTTKKAPPDIGLFMECTEEDLEPSQIKHYSNAEKEYMEIQNKLDLYVKKLNAEIIEKRENCQALQLNITPLSESVNTFGQIPSSHVNGQSIKQNAQNGQGYQQVLGSGILARSSPNTSGNTFLVMDSGLSFMVGQMSTTNTTEQSPPHSKPNLGGRNRPSVTSRPLMVATRTKLNSRRQIANSVETDFLISPSAKTRDKVKNQLISHQQASSNTSPIIAEQIYSSESSLNSCGNYRLKANAKPLPEFLKPAEINSIGGLTAGNKICGKQLTCEEFTSSDKYSSDSKEVPFNKMTGKTFPSLVVIARPHLKAKYIHQSKIVQERTALDAKVKGVLMYTPTKFTEWLIQQGLIKNEQICQNHVNIDLSPVKLKLGMYSDISKFPHSGGYVWISDCCPSQFVSVFSGSIFEGAPHSPATLLKLIYHWACQTNIQNIIQWVKVDNLYVKNFFTNMRAVCTQAVHEKYKKMGGQRKKIEVGVISLGTTSQDGNKRQVKVEVLGVMDHESKLIRLRAVEPHSDERSFKRRFVRILQPLEDWVSKDSTILTDFTVNKAALNSMGFHTVYQVTSDVKYSNQNVMEYLRKIVPRMFQNTLSLLSRQIIQQFLDELVWREVWGPIPSQAFTTIIAHMSEQMKLDVSESFPARLNQVASNPFKDWKYSVWTSSNSGKGILKRQSQKPAMSYVSEEPSTQVHSPELVIPQVKCNRSRKRGPEQSATEVFENSLPVKKSAKTCLIEKMKREKESEEKLSEEIIEFINEGNQIPLETYYYGSFKGKEIEGKRESLSCCVCNKRFSENILLMKHIVLHCQMEPALSSNIKIHQCEHCFLGFNTSSELKNHLEAVHYLVDDKLISNYLCQICEKIFASRIEFVYHMHQTHVEKELPYECGVCKFRTSIYRLIIRHFVQVHKGEEYVFCPFCLKTVAITHKTNHILSNVLFYLTHLERHYRKSLSKDCVRCRLTFIHQGILNQHLEADHGSWKTEPDVQPLTQLSISVLMPEPGCLIKPGPVLKLGRPQKTKNLFTVNKFTCLSVQGLDENSTCVECEEFLLESDHFTGNFSCLKCRYETCCEKAMLEHTAIFHEAAILRFTMGKPIVLENEMFCICGYSSTSGNRMAKHLIFCENKTAYANSNSAIAPSQSSVEAIAIEENFKGESQNVLNFLGLIRKSPERFTAPITDNKEGQATEQLNKKIMNLNEPVQVGEIGCEATEEGNKTCLQIKNENNSQLNDYIETTDFEMKGKFLEKKPESSRVETNLPIIDKSAGIEVEVQFFENEKNKSCEKENISKKKTTESEDEKASLSDVTVLPLPIDEAENKSTEISRGKNNIKIKENA